MAKDNIVFREYRKINPIKRGMVSNIGKGLFLKSLLKNTKKGS
jgi:hypothetical protein